MEHALECHEPRLPNLGLPAVGLVRWFLLARSTRMADSPPYIQIQSGMSAALSGGWGNQRQAPRHSW